jgi:transcriptional regulator with XRE-family HTH domain
MGEWELVPGSRSLSERLEDREFRRAYDHLKLRFEVARELVNLRHTRGLTQQELAKRLGTRQSRVSKIESAEHDSKLGTIVEVAHALEADIRISITPREAAVRVMEIPCPVSLSISFEVPNAVPVPWVIQAEPKVPRGTSARTGLEWRGLPVAPEEPEKAGVVA